MREWYIKINRKEEGPFSLLELSQDSRITPQTLVKREGELFWRPASLVKELQFLFQKMRFLPGEIIARNEQMPAYVDWVYLLLLILILWIIYLIFK